MRRKFNMSKLKRFSEIIQTINPNQISEITVTEIKLNSTEIPNIVVIKIGYIEYQFVVTDSNDEIHERNYSNVISALSTVDDSIKINVQILKD